MSESTNLTVLGIDLEGMNADLLLSGVNIATDRVIEIGAVLWDWDSRQPVKILSELTDEVDRLPISEEVELITGINDSMLSKWALKGDEIRNCLKDLANLMEKADYLMAHNGTGYDRPMITGMFKRYDISMPETIWIDTMSDIEFPKKINGRSLAMLEHSHGFVNPFPHRAVTDVLAMLKVATNYSLPRMIQLAKSPTVTLVASLDAPNWRNQKEVAEFNAIKNKVARSRFKWNPTSKQWRRDVPQILVDEGNLNLDFEFFIK
jgi:DNA polymerase-3 subunit epsilon